MSGTNGDIATHRPRLFGLAYRMLGSATQAEDVVQDAFERWYTAPRDDVRNEAAFLMTTVTNLCLDHLKSARAQRELYPGEWLPEPIAVDAEGLSDELSADTHYASAETDLERLESISLAFLAVLDTLTPLERAVYLLHDVFDCSHADVARSIGRTETACRQIYRRAKQALKMRKPATGSPERHRELLAAFLAACERGDLDGLTRLLAADVVVRADGGGKAAATNRPVVGALQAARLYVGLAKRFLAGTTTEIRSVNGWPALVVREDDVLRSVIQLHSDGERIDTIYAVVNPDKLARLAAALELRTEPAG
jgi:RNA polymerase sigma-70 factor (ECF subfamily)